MIHQLTKLNWVSVLLATAVYFILGFLWFTKFFSKAYKTSLGRENETLPNKPIFIIGPALCTLVITVASAILMDALGISTFMGAVKFALFVGFGYLFANTVNIAINPNMPRPIFYGMLVGAYHVIGILIASVIMVAMK
jgi:hypothetical protein